MKEVKLQFKTLEDLWTFKSSVKAYNITVIASNAILIATLSDQSIELALTVFQAKPVKGKPNQFS